MSDSEETATPVAVNLPDWAQRFIDEHMSLQELGDLLGITREGARLRLKKLGITPRGTKALAAHRSELERAARADRVRAIQSTRPSLREVLIHLAQDGLTRDEALPRLAYFYPDWSEDDIVGVAESWGISFANGNHGEAIFSDAALEGALLYLLGAHLSLQPDIDWSAQHLPDPLVRDVAGILSEAGLAPRETATVLGVIGAARRGSIEEPVSITGKEYEALRAELLGSMGLVSAKGAMLWPPTRQTFMKRFGGWNDALTALGLATAKLGRPKGLLQFSAEDYTSAVRDFLQGCQADGVSDTYSNYETWVQNERASNRKRPSGAALRNFFGSWHEVKLAVATGFAGVQAVRAAGTLHYSEADYLEALRRFIAEATVGGVPIQSATYQDWVHTESREGRPRPSSGSVQKFFGSWNQGLRAARKGTARVTSPVFHIANERRGVDARARLVDGKFVLLAGSHVVSAWTPPDGASEETLRAYQRYEVRRDELVADGSIAADGRTTRDILFDSSTAAASVALGRGSSGRTEWIMPDGQTYGGWESEDSSLGGERGESALAGEPEQ